MKKVGIQGKQGSYHEMAAQKMEGVNVIVYFLTFQELFTALKTKKIDQAIVAIANNRHGFIAEPYAELIDNPMHYQIVGELYIKVEHQLLGLAGTNIEDIKEVHSQAPAIGQCNKFLTNVLPNALIIEEHDTAQSAEIVANLNIKSNAAIASKRAKDLYGLEVLAANIQDDHDNVTRFLILEPRSKEKFAIHGDKTTMLLRTHQVAGSLAANLQLFKERNINLSTIHSSFLPNTGFEMQFLVECDAGLQEDRMKTLFEELDSLGSDYTVLGSYMHADMPIKKGI